ncbi:fumarate reductase flavoprotein subunit [Sedimentibacter acidaminivorans]|uniref:Fumarate reductase flavoprotein subunit n=1 Tax=Sedimentibacter acidaminivorans TaxID=913099 RepID=A0ABS4GEK9_9FIRM|nr:FAD-dependent oxidoreductase [Sedimentibacter acidaminivorans]MBP1925800.1 fumarate reductase flavoprotein subunit [Sedimentibacter acidaminivorans]
MSKNYEADVIVIGGGASGITAAVASAEKDASVIVLEKGSTTGGAANMGMGIFAVESKYQKAQLVDFSKEDAFNLLMNYTHWRVDARLVRKYIEQSSNTIEWMESLGVEFLGAYKYFEKSTQTWHIVKTKGSNAPAERSASNMFRALTERSEELGVEILYNTKATQILMENGYVTGVEFVGEDGEKVIAECNAVIVATGGFGDNPKMIQDILGYEWGKDLHSFRIPGVQGEGLRMLWEAGAGKTVPTMELTFTTPGVTDVFKTLSETMRQPNLMVNLDGKRFYNEELMSNTVYTGNAISLQRERMAFTIIDDSILNTYRKTGLDYVTIHHNIKTVDKWDKELQTYLSGGQSEKTGLSELHNEEQKHQVNIYEADTLEELCEKTGICLENLKQTLEEYNESCTTSDEMFFKKHKYMKPFKSGKFYAARHYPAGYGSLGGVKTNDNMEVLNDAGIKISGLYACGTDACNIYGDSYCFFLPGNTMSFAVNSGRIAGYSAVEYMDSDEFN